MTTRFLKRLPLAVALLTALAGAAQAQSISLLDPTFSAPDLGYANGSWSIGSGTPELVGGLLDLDAGDSVYQSFSVLSTAVYQISFTVSGEGRSRLFLSSDVGLSNFTSPVATSGTVLNEVTDWGSTPVTASYNFNGVAGTSYHLYFSGFGSGVTLDNVAISAPVPEPETYAMMLAGLGALGFMSRRRKAAARLG
ncbi:hypothetical protein X805_09240 [Sphaerotilus natans subsp. natans DSM 6575]|jgi:hypothetical protein|uniref:Ice-binding protein C-terminal domain-containing protein n=1 Tax=Sphaerotilus natans subsp. natans DSM 6575 TaxID=1286631 RepID=A0A059KQH3_9BURK|nr:PEP-CTERM sorting domain-containing protein [Sphaerotilus natans]KDB53469.1 hypothetical protein X805_09240 [Sphaerotilus natans subsp. natans DSM 6575]SIQ87928.1 PEP-CTERM protein-sorting domain-containing protein [Sphaerotilus natans]